MESLENFSVSFPILHYWHHVQVQGPLESVLGLFSPTPVSSTPNFIILAAQISLQKLCLSFLSEYSKIDISLCHNVFNILMLSCVILQHEI